jgi:hypothetical protein
MLLVMRALACSVEVFLHRSSTFGERYLGAQAAIAALILFVLPAFVPTQDPTALWCFLGAFIIACAMVSAGSVKRRQRGELGHHSFYTGTPVLLGGTGEATVKRVFEPLLVGTVGAVVSEVDPLLGGYLVFASAGLIMSVNLSVAAERKRLLDMHDAYMEQRRAAEEWRSMHRE